jgi:plastocyanin
MICLTAGIAAGVALARPADRVTTVAAPPGVAVDAAGASDYGASDSGTPGYGDPTPGYGDPAPAADASAEPADVTIEGFAFSAPASVAPGETLSVTNLDTAPHTFTARDGSFDTGNLGNGDRATVTAPTEPGTYEFVCSIHASMTGSFTVG